MNINEITQLITKQKEFKDDKVIISLLSKVLVPILMILGFYIHIKGDNSAGGGFQSGVIFTYVFCLYNFIIFETNQKKIIKQNSLIFISLLGLLFYLFSGIMIIYYNKINMKNLIDIIEIGISLIIFSSFYRIFLTLLSLLKNKNY